MSSSARSARFASRIMSFPHNCCLLWPPLGNPLPQPRSRSLKARANRPKGGHTRVRSSHPLRSRKLPGLRLQKSFFDGASKGNPGEGGAGAVVYLLRDDGSPVTVIEGYKYLQRCTNNHAEYQGLLLGLEQAHQRGAKNVEVQGDSDLVIKQVSGAWRVKSDALRPLYQDACSWALKFEKIRFTHVPREQNSRADALANEAVRTRKKTDPGEGL
eukprot:Rmarinus@m.11158